MNKPTKLLSQYLDEVAEYVNSEEELAISFTKYFKESIEFLEMNEKYIAMDAYFEGANVGREMMKAWMQGKETDIKSFDEFKKYWAENNNKKEANG